MTDSSKLETARELMPDGASLDPESAQQTVFIVDDDPAVRSALSFLFQSVDLHAETYDSAHSFLEAYNPTQSGCLVLDVHMPVMNGIELQEQLAARQANIPIILLTGYADVPTAIRAFKGGAIDLIEKPFDNEVLLKRVREALALSASNRQEPELASLTLASMGDGVITTDGSGTITYLNPTAEYLTGWRDADARNKSLLEVFNVVDESSREPLKNLLAPCLNGEPDTSDEDNRTVLIQRDGHETAIEKSLAPIRDQTGNIRGAVILFHDVTQARAVTRQLSYQATHDPLTGLINRREFEQRLERVLKNSQQRKLEHTLCYLDLDRFKLVNDAAGHAAGDQLLHKISLLWTKKLRQRDTLARLGGDEFALLLEYCPLDRGIEIAQELLKATQDFHLLWEEQIFHIGVSIGVTGITATSRTVHQILQVADAACYAAKRAGRNRLHVHHPGTDGEQRRDWVAHLDKALREDRLQLFHQLLTPMLKHQKGHYQILLRMQGNAEEAVTTGTFLPAYERANLAPVLDRWMIRQILKWLNSDPKWLPQLRLCLVNMSRYTLEDKDFPDFWAQQLEQSGIPASKLCLAFSETTILSDLDGALRLLRALKTTGCRVAVDDFASTPSGFYYLRHLPVDFIKIDGRLIRAMVDDPVAFAMVKSSNEIAHIMGIQTIAKNVDDAAIMDKLRPLQVDYLQGYHVANPVRLES